MAGMGNYSMSVQNQNQTPASVFYSMGNMANANAAAVAGQVRAPNSLYTRALATADAVAFSNLISGELDRLRSQTRTDGFKNNLNYLQALLRSSGGSKGTTALGAFDLNDLKALRETMVNSYTNGVEYFSWLEGAAKTGLNSGGPKTTFNKDISTALNLIDKTDATTSFTKGYYTATGMMPSATQINNFMKKFNAQAKKEAVTTTRSGTATTSTGGSTSKYTSTTSGMGFTAEEQSNFLAKEISKGLTLTPEMGGAVKDFYDDIRATYKNNNLSEPSFEQIAVIVKDIVGTGDATMAKQKLDAAKQNIRNIAAKLNPGLADILASGENINTIADQYIKLAQSVTKQKYDMSSPLIKQMINYKDDKGVVRTATDWEALGIIRGSSDWLNSNEAQSTFNSIGDVVTSKLGL
jgi:hypothetical protein